MVFGNTALLGRGANSVAPNRRRGVAAVELAVVGAFLVTLMFAILELGRGIIVKQNLTDSARRGARLGAQPGTTTAAINAEVNLFLSNNNIPTANVTTTVLVNGNNVDASTAVQNDKISVQVAIPVASVYWMATVFLNSSEVQSEIVTMMRYDHQQ
jgi:Flp pilus assembly protein TadG